MRNDLQDVKNQLIEFKVREESIQDIKNWKEKIDEVASPSQMKTAFEDISELKEFKTKAITAFMVVQFFMASIMAVLQMM